MNKNAIKKFATEARRELISRVSQRALKYGISEKETGNPNDDSVNGHLLSSTEKKQRAALIEQIQEKGYEQVMEEVAYTWFNRFSALRFMEVNAYLPSRVRVFTDEDNAFKPQILTEAIHLDLDGLDMEKVYAYKDANDNDELYKYLLITQCNALNSVLPGMFQKIADYTELLFPDNLLREGSVIQLMIELIPEEDWKDQVQIIGWLYEAYNTERNELVYNGSMSKVRITKELLPAATTIFTPDWPIRYMVENSIGRLWLEGHPETSEQLLPTEEEQSAYVAGNHDPEDSKWHYYLEEAEQEPEVEKQLAEIRRDYAALTPDQLKLIDPCAGSGHILAYMFDVLMQIYESYGYTTRDAVSSIVEHNLYGLDIDDRAAQLAYFAVMMKARQYDRRFFSRGIQPHVYAIAESNHVDSFAVEYFCKGDAKLTAAMDTILHELHDAKEYGSILTVTPQDWTMLYDRFAEIEEDIHLSRETALRELLPLVQVAEALAQKYDAIVTNPPYLGNARFSPLLDKYVKDNYADVKTDLSMVMFKKMLSKHIKTNGFISFITTSSWMFLSSFEKLRNFMFENSSIESVIDFGTELFDGKVGHNPIVAWVNRKSNIDLRLTAVRLVDYCYSRRDEKRFEFFQEKNKHISHQDNFKKIPGNPLAYWVSEKFSNIFSYSNISDYGFAGIGMRTGDNERFLRRWYEISQKNMCVGCHDKDAQIESHKKWVPYNKGGEYRKWYGNNEYVVNWYNNGEEIKENTRRVYPYLGDDLGWKISNESYYYKPGITWSGVTSGKNSFRAYSNGFIFDSGANGFFPSDESMLDTLTAYLNSCISQYVLNIINPTINTGAGTVKKVPIILPNDEKVKKLLADISSHCIEVSKYDWDSFETSWDFQHHPLIRKVPTIAEAFDQWQAECDERFHQLKANEEELNRIFIDIYGLQDELTPEVEDKDVTVRKADLGRDIRSFISYAVGCMFGRYSLDVDGLAYAGGKWDSSKYVSFAADKDNIIPICDDEYFTDDIVGRFMEFVKTVYGAETLDKNLKFIADALGGKGQPKDVIRNYFLNDFYADHCRMYQKRPIYWLFDSGKKNGFKALIYMHRYQPDTIARIRTDYVHEQQARYRTAIADLEARATSASTSERVKLNKQLKTLNEQATEIHVYEEKIHHLADQMISIDLDDGVKVNYAKFQDVLAKIK